MKDEILIELVKDLQEAFLKAREINIGDLPVSDIHTLVNEGGAIQRVINHVLGEEKSEEIPF